MQIRSNQAARYFAPHFEQTFSGFFPKAAALAFDGDQAVCLLSRSNGPNSDRSTLIGRSNAPYTDWNWTWFGLQVSHPNLVRTPDGRIVAGVGLHEPRQRTSLCVLDRTSGELAEVLELPTRGRAIDVGLATHDGHLWASCHLADGGEYQVHVEKIVLPAGQ